ncbi:MAG TPA: histidine phosphatase family protein [Nitriliruptorales bacterium]|nr:histidine phosphatase family protein [Nitriliruptorales bacterium]
MPTVVLVRHAVTAATGKRLGGRTTASLSDQGRAQAVGLAERLCRSKVTAVYASPVPRTVQTAEAIAQRVGLQVRELVGVLEFDYGAWTDRPLGQLRRTKLWRAIQAAPSRVAFPDGESFVAAQQRAVAAIESLSRQHTDRQTVVVVSHADIIKVVVAHYAGIPLDLFQRLTVAPASVTVLGVPRSGPPLLLRLNDTGDLSPGSARTG